jgi:uncharacterized MAPEG superfamily protein
MLLASQRWQTESATLIGGFHWNAGPNGFVAELVSAATNVAQELRRETSPRSPRSLRLQSRQAR